MLGSTNAEGPTSRISKPDSLLGSNLLLPDGSLWAEHDLPAHE